jgi:ComF family protein
MHRNRKRSAADCISGLRQPVSRMIFAALDVVLPHACLLCGVSLAGRCAGLCADCRGRFEHITGPVCSCCGAVFSSLQGGDHLCGTCIERPAHYALARSAGVYAGELRRAIQQFKFSRRSMLAGSLAEYAAQQCRVIGPQRGYAALVPVPLHPKRLSSRGYNQSLLLALQLGRLWDVPVEREYLQRTAWSVSQTSLRRSERRRAVRGAFTCRDRRFEGARLLLIDDVFTSGATVDECARMLKRCGAAAVDVLTVARTLKDHPECQVLSA